MFGKQEEFGFNSNIAFDTKGHLIGVDDRTHLVTVFKTPNKKGSCGSKLGSFIDPFGEPDDAASVDAATGTIAVANFMGPNNSIGNVAICSLASGCTSELTNGSMQHLVGIAMASNGDCWVYAATNSGPATLLPGGSGGTLGVAYNPRSKE